MPWTVAQTKPGKERQAIESLQRFNYTIYAPQFRNAQRHKSLLYPGYIFVKYVWDWHGVFRAPGVAHYFLNGKYNSYDYPRDPEPVKIPDAFIKELKSYEGIDGVIKFTFRPNQKLRILRGKFKNMLATYKCYDPKSGDLVEVDFMGRKVTLAYKPGYLAA